MKKLLIASSNAGKIHELTALLENLDLVLVTPQQLDLHLESRRPVRLTPKTRR